MDEEERRRAAFGELPDLPDWADPTRRKPPQVAEPTDRCNCHLGPWGRERCDRKQGHKGFHRIKGVEYTASTVVAWASTLVLVAIPVGISLGILFGVRGAHQHWLDVCFDDGARLGVETRIETHVEPLPGQIGGPDFCLFLIDGEWVDRRSVLPDPADCEWNKWHRQVDEEEYHGASC